MARTLLQLRTAVRQRADMENSTFISDSELNDYINASAAELHDILTTTFEDYFLTSQIVTVASGTNSIPLPYDLLKLKGLDYQYDSSPRWMTVRPFVWAERNDTTPDRRMPLRYGPFRTYRVGPSEIFLLPESDASGTYRIWYLQTYLPLMIDSSVYLVPQYWDEYVIVDAAMKCLIKEESDVSTLAAMKGALMQRILNAAPNRDAGEAPRVADVSSSDYTLWDWLP